MFSSNIALRIEGKMQTFISQKLVYKSVDISIK